MQLNKNIMKSVNKNIVRDVPGAVKYAGLQMRLIASLIDCALIAILLLPLFAFTSNIIYNGILPASVIAQAIQDMQTLQEQTGQPVSLFQFIANNEQLKQYFFNENGLIRVVIDQLLQITILCVAIIWFWFKKQATPGKIFLSMKIVDAKTLGKPSHRQLIIRLFSYIISILPALIGVIWIAFDSKKQGWHDKIANTLVIEEKKKK